MDKGTKGLKMVRSGEFDIETYGENHCGTDNEFKIRYHLICDCKPVLDSRGFLFDQLNIQSYFESIKRTQMSCERLTVVCLEQLLEHILVENPTCQIYRMELTLSPSPFLASMTHFVESVGDEALSLPKAKKLALKVKRSAKIEDVPEGHPLLNLSHLDGAEAGTHKPSFDHYVFHEETNQGNDD